MEITIAVALSDQTTAHLVTELAAAFGCTVVSHTNPVPNGTLVVCDHHTNDQFGAHRRIILTDRIEPFTPDNPDTVLLALPVTARQLDEAIALLTDR